MKNYWIICLLLPLLVYWGCNEDTSAYLPQEKEQVALDDVNPENEDNETGDEVLPEGQLVTGMHQVKLDVVLEDGTVMQRKFKYYLPITVDQSQPISLIFEFHGSWDFKAGEEPQDPIGNISKSHALIQHAIRNNCVICFPAGTAEYLEDGSGAVNWQDSRKHLPFVDAMVDYFKGRSPFVDSGRIYATGQSSGAIFSFVLAYERSEVFAAITPRAGQMSIEGRSDLPVRAVPIRVFAGVDDNVVQHDAVISNMTLWAERIGGYFETDMVLTEDSIEIEDYKSVDTRIWEGGNADLQIFSLKDEGHGISVYYCLPYMWEFMSAHTLTDGGTSLYITSDTKSVVAQCAEPVKVRINYTEGATVSLENIPKGWKVELEGKTVTFVAPSNFFGNIAREGEMLVRVSKGEASKTMAIHYELQAPKTYFEVGDIYYNDAFEPVGVVCWVDDSDIRKAKIIDLTGCGDWGNIWYCGGESGLGLSFETPSRTDGRGNTEAMVTFNRKLAEPYTADDAAFMWAAEYSYKGVSGWYLPAIDELKAIAGNQQVINKALASIDAVQLKPNWGAYTLFSSTTVVEDGADRKSVYAYNFTAGKEEVKKSKTAGYEYFGFIFVRAIKEVSK